MDWVELFPIASALSGRVGGLIGTQLGWGNVHGFDLRSLGLAIGGGVLVLFIAGLFRKAA